ncbi:MAG: YiiX/YebB-like N1pC/P60 family cysteine hydrolase, partial [Gemmataceae bacterium]
MAAYLLALLVVSGANPPDVTGTNPLKLIHDELPNGELVREDYVPQPGDIVLFQTGHVAARVLCHLILCGQATHVGIVVTRADGTLGILETPTVGANVAINDLADQIHHYNGAVWVRRRTQNITRNQSERLSKFAQAQVGKPY